MPERIKHELSEYERQGAWYQNGFDAGRAEGLAEGVRTMLLLLLDHHRIVLRPEHRTRLERCSSSDQMRRWFERAVVATNAAGIFGEDG